MGARSGTLFTLLAVCFVQTFSESRRHLDRKTDLAPNFPANSGFLPRTTRAEDHTPPNIFNVGDLHADVKASEFSPFRKYKKVLLLRSILNRFEEDRKVGKQRDKSKAAVQSPSVIVPSTDSIPEVLKRPRNFRKALKKLRKRLRKTVQEREHDILASDPSLLISLSRPNSHNHKQQQQQQQQNHNRHNTETKDNGDDAGNIKTSLSDSHRRKKCRRKKSGHSKPSHVIDQTAYEGHFGDIQKQPNEGFGELASVNNNQGGFESDGQWGAIPSEDTKWELVPDPNSLDLVRQPEDQWELAPKEASWDTAPQAGQWGSEPKDTQLDPAPQDTQWGSVPEDTQWGDPAPQSPQWGSVPKDTQWDSAPQDTQWDPAPQDTQWDPAPQGPQWGSVPEDTQWGDPAPQSPQWDPAPQDTQWGPVPEGSQWDSVPQDQWDSAPKENQWGSVVDGFAGDLDDAFFDKELSSINNGDEYPQYVKSPDLTRSEYGILQGFETLGGKGNDESDALGNADMMGEWGNQPVSDDNLGAVFIDEDIFVPEENLDTGANRLGTYAEQDSDNKNDADNDDEEYEYVDCD